MAPNVNAMPQIGNNMSSDMAYMAAQMGSA